MKDDTISRREAIRIASGYCHPANVAKELAKLPAVQPQRKTDEWCTDCREYDSEKHCCPRFNRVIRQTLSEQRKTGQWIHIRTEEDGNALYECSECHMGEVHVPIVEVKYCWNCGSYNGGEE